MKHRHSLHRGPSLIPAVALAVAFGCSSSGRGPGPIRPRAKSVPGRGQRHCAGRGLAGRRVRRPGDRAVDGRHPGSTAAGVHGDRRQAGRPARWIRHPLGRSARGHGRSRRHEVLREIIWMPGWIGWPASAAWSCGMRTSPRSARTLGVASPGSRHRDPAAGRSHPAARHGPGPVRRTDPTDRDHAGGSSGMTSGPRSAPSTISSTRGTGPDARCGS